MNKIASSESVVKDIRRRTRRKYSLEVKIRIVLEPVVKFAKPSINYYLGTAPESATNRIFRRREPATREEKFCTDEGLVSHKSIAR